MDGPSCYGSTGESPICCGADTQLERHVVPMNWPCEKPCSTNSLMDTSRERLASIHRGEIPSQTLLDGAPSVSSVTRFTLSSLPSGDLFLILLATEVDDKHQKVDSWATCPTDLSMADRLSGVDNNVDAWNRASAGRP